MTKLDEIALAIMAKVNEGATYTDIARAAVVVMAVPPERITETIVEVLKRSNGIDHRATALAIWGCVIATILDNKEEQQ